MTKQETRQKKLSKKNQQQAKTPVEILAIIDRSGSMSAIKNDAIGGLNEFIKEQQAASGEANITVILFDHEYIDHCVSIPIKDLKLFTEETYKPRGMTRLLDAIGKGINTISEEIIKQNKNSKVIVSILTDGYENDSREYKKDQIIELLANKRKENWEFIFLGADEKAIEDAIQWGFHKIDTQSFVASGEGVRSGYARMSGMTVSYRDQNEVNKSKN